MCLQFFIPFLRVMVYALILLCRHVQTHLHQHAALAVNPAPLLILRAHSFDIVCPSVACSCSLSPCSCSPLSFIWTPARQLFSFMPGHFLTVSAPLLHAPACACAVCHPILAAHFHLWGHQQDSTAADHPHHDRRVRNHKPKMRQRQQQQQQRQVVVGCSIFASVQQECCAVRVACLLWDAAEPAAATDNSTIAVQNSEQLRQLLSCCCLDCNRSVHVTTALSCLAVQQLCMCLCFLPLGTTCSCPADPPAASRNCTSCPATSQEPQSFTTSCR
jgi:hypothetical protein